MTITDSPVPADADTAEPERSPAAGTALLADEAERLRKKRKRARRRAAETERVEQACRRAVAEAETQWRAEQNSTGSGLGDYLNPRRHPVVAAVAFVCAAAVIASAILAVLFARSSSDLAALRTLTSNEQTAETVAGKYAVGAATFNHDDLPAWSAALKTGTAQELNSRFDLAVKTLTPLIAEVQWTQTAELIAATTVDVRPGGQFVVQVFVATHMTSTQNPGGLNTVTPYTITLDSTDDWLITDVAGIAGVAQDGSAPEIPGPAAPQTTAPAPTS